MIMGDSMFKRGPLQRSIAIAASFMMAAQPLVLLADDIQAGRQAANDLFNDYGVSNFDGGTNFFSEEGISADSSGELFRNEHDRADAASVDSLQSSSFESAESMGRSAANSMSNDDSDDPTATAFGIGEDVARERRLQLSSSEAIDVFGENWDEILAKTDVVWSESLSEDFTDCDATLVREESLGETIEYHVADERQCSIVHELTGCTLEREVTINQQKKTSSRSTSQCFATRNFSISAPANSDAMFKGAAGLNIISSSHITAAITQQPSRDNGWVTQVEAKGPWERKPASVPANVAEVIPGECTEDEKGNETCEEDTYVYDCSTAPADPVHAGFDVSTTSWTLEGQTCYREESGCFTPTQPQISFDVEFDGIYLESSFKHDPNEDVISSCIIESDGWTSARWDCLDSSSKTLPAPGGWGSQTIGKNELQSLVPDMMYPDDPKPVDTTVSQPMSDNQGAWCWRAYGEYNHETGIPEFGFGASDPYEDAHGDIQKIIVDVGDEDVTFRNSCAALEDNPQCVHKRTICVGESTDPEAQSAAALYGEAFGLDFEGESGARGHEGFCYIEEKVYDCGETVVVEDFTIQRVNACNNVIQCRGPDGDQDCFEMESSSMAEYAETAAYLQAAEHMSNDMSCVNEQPSELAEKWPIICKLWPHLDACTVTTTEFTSAPDPSQCTVFSGKDMRCKVPLYGWVVDCCDNPQPPPFGLGMFLGAVMGASKLDSSIMAADDNGPMSGLKGSYSTLRDPIAGSFETITTPIASFKENIAGVTSPVTSSVSDFASNLSGSLKDKVGSIPGVGGSGFEEAIIGANPGQLLGALSTAYTAYNVAVMIISLIWKCSESEFELDVNRELKKCHYVGSYCHRKISLGLFGSLCVEKRQSYCCFSSPMSRIIQQQARPQLGRSWGSPKNPSCGGLTIDEITNLDWDKVDLSEWTGLLELNDMGPSADFGMESLTGSGNIFAVDEDRPNASQRASQRMEGIDVDAINADATQDLPLDYK